MCSLQAPENNWKEYWRERKNESLKRYTLEGGGGDSN